jgi:opacity protein-like surface antigen
MVRRMLSLRSIPLLAIMTPLGVALGCTTMDLKIDDNDAVTPGGRISYEIYPGADRRRSGALLDLVTGSAAGAQGNAVTAQSAGIAPTISIDGEIASVESRDHEQVPAGQQVELDEVIVGPARVKLNAQNLRGSLAARGGVRFYDVLSLEAIMGLGVDSTEVRMRGDGVTASHDQLLAGFLLGGRATVRPIALFDVYAQYTVNITDEAWKYIQDAQVGVELNLQRNVSVFGGYRWWRYEESLSNESNWELRLRGPTAGLCLKF